MVEKNEKIEQISHGKARRHTPTVLLAGIALLLALFAVLQLEFSEHNLSTSFKETGKKVSSLQIQIQNMQKNLDQFRQATIDWQAQVQQKIASQPMAADQSSWTLSEVNYLVQLANYQVTFSKDVMTAITLLQTADQRLASLSNPNFNQVRTVLAAALAALQAVPKVDTAGLLARINALQIQATQLPLLVPTSIVMPKEDSQKTQPSTKSDWRMSLKKSWESLQKLIVIRHHDQPIAPLLPQEQQIYLQQNLQLLLQQAQWAVLQRQETVYQSSLQQARMWVATYFTGNAAATQAMLQAIQELQQINVQPKTPDISNVLQVLQRVIATETKDHTTTNKPS